MIKSISYSYWRSIKRGKRLFNDIKDASIKKDVTILANEDLNNNIITQEQFEELLQLNQ